MSMLLRRYHGNNIKAKGATTEVAPKAVENKSTEKATVTADEIKAMNGNKLRKFAKENGVESPEELTVGELKAVLCDKFG